MNDFRCTLASQDLGEGMAGSASTARSFLLLESDGGWGVDALTDSRLDLDVRRRLRGLGRLGVKTLLIRGHGRQRTSMSRVFAAHVGSAAGSAPPWTESAVLDDPRDLLDLPLDGLARGESIGLAPYDEPLFCVCTHGRHDVCCAELGRPLCRAMHEVDPAHTWEVSHIGGDRFAPNVLVLPQGLYYGRLTPADAAGLVGSVTAGELDLDHLRGRSSLSFAEQFAEIAVRRQVGHLGIDALPVLHHSREGDRTRVVFVVAGERWEVLVRTDRSEPRRLTCRASGLSTGGEHHLLRVHPA